MTAVSPVPRAARMPPLPERLPITLAALLGWTYRRQKADVMSGRGLRETESDFAADGPPIRRRSGCGCAQIETVAALGIRLVPGVAQRGSLHPDAEAVHDAVIALARDDAEGAMLLRRYGRTDDRPDWAPGPQEFEPLRDGRDRIVQDRYDEVVRLRDRKGRERLVPLHYCPLVRHPSDEWVAMVRAEYRLWFAALERLEGLLSSRPLRRWRLTGLGAVAEPWADSSLPNKNKS